MTEIFRSCLSLQTFFEQLARYQRVTAVRKPGRPKSLKFQHDRPESLIARGGRLRYAEIKAMGSALTAAHYEVALMAPTNTKVGVRLEPEKPRFII